MRNQDFSNEQNSSADLKLYSGFAATILCLILSGFFLKANIASLEEMSDERSHVRQTAYKIKSLNSLLIEAETGQRGFLLTGKIEYLAPYLESSHQIRNEYKDLKERLTQQPDQLARLVQLETLIESKLSELEQTVQLKRSKGLNEALKLMRTDRGLQDMTQIRRLMREMDQEQLHQLEQLAERMHYLIARSSFVVVASSAFALILVSVFLFLLNNNRKRRLETERAVLEKNRELENQKALLAKVVSAQNKIATAGTDSQAIMDMVVEQTMKLTNSDGSIIEIVDGDDLVYHHACGVAKPFLGMRIPRQGSFSGLCLKYGKPLICHDSEIDERVNRDACRKVHLRSMVTIPLYHRSRVIGVLKNYSSLPHHFTEESVNTLALVTGIMTATLGQANEFEEKSKVVEDLENAKRELTISKNLAEEATKAKSRFLATMSHEFRTPLNGILGMAGLLMDTDLNDRQKEDLRSIRLSGESLLRLVNDILDFSKSEAGKIEFEQVDFDLVSTLQDIKKSFVPIAQKKGLELEVDLSPDLPPYVNGDPGRLRQILMNLIGNALKFTEKGFVKIRARSLQRTNEKVKLRFEVQDSGIGIENEAIQKLFKEFSQADASTTRKYGGTGLGLSISKHLVHQMSGEIGVESTPPKGSTFWFTVELALGSQITVNLEQDEEILDLPERERPWRILVADDNQVNQLLAVRMLEKMGLRADAVANGLEVIAALKNAPYDIILMDCNMPEMDGFEATAWIRQGKTHVDPQTPVIAMTANAMAEDAERCLAAGMNAYISKPIPFKVFKSLMLKWLHIAHNRQQKIA